MAGESELWNDIKNGKYQWVTIKSSKKHKLFRLIDIYSKLDDLIEDVKEVNKNVGILKELKNAPEDWDWAEWKIIFNINIIFKL